MTAQGFFFEERSLIIWHIAGKKLSMDWEDKGVMRVGRNGDRKENEKMESLASLRKLITNSQFNILIP